MLNLLLDSKDTHNIETQEPKSALLFLYCMMLMSLLARPAAKNQVLGSTVVPEFESNKLQEVVWLWRKY